MNLVLNLLAISRSIKPSDIRLSAEPSHLTFRIAPGITLDYTNRFLLWDRGIDSRDNVPISDRLKRLGAGRNAACQQRANFIDQTGLRHPPNALVDPSVELFSRRVQPDYQEVEALDRMARSLLKMLRQRFAGFQADLQRSNDFRLVAFGDA